MGNLKDKKLKIIKDGSFSLAMLRMNTNKRYFIKISFLSSLNYLILLLAHSHKYIHIYTDVHMKGNKWCLSKDSYKLKRIF